VARLRAGRSIPGRDNAFFSTAWRPTLRRIQWLPKAMSPGIKWLGREAEHLPQSSAKAKNAWMYAYIPPFVFMVWCLIKQRDNFIFILDTYEMMLWIGFICLRIGSSGYHLLIWE
jgi:hypothetical protein